MSESRGAFWPKFSVMLIVGIGLMIGGMAFSKNVHIGFLEELAAKGIPLDFGKTIAVIGVFLIVFPVIDFFYLKPLKEAIDNRTQSLEHTFGEAEGLRAEMTTLKSDYEKRLADTEASARQQIQDEIKRAQELRRQLEADAAAKADAMVKQAQAEIAAERDRALTQIRVDVTKLSLQATERILGENMDNDRNRRLIDEFLDKVEVAGR